MEALQLIKDYSGITKSEIKAAATVAVENVLEDGNPLEVAESLSAMEDFIKSVKADKRFTEYVREETVKHGKVYNSASGTKIEIAETGTKYEFSVCGDIILDEMEQKLMSIENDVKARKDFLKTLPISGMDIITPDGEAIKVFPPSKTSTSSYKVTLAK